MAWGEAGGEAGRGGEAGVAPEQAGEGEGATREGEGGAREGEGGTHEGEAAPGEAGESGRHEAPAALPCGCAAPARGGGGSHSHSPASCAAFQRALLSNSNLAGDSVNRGMLLGALAGAAVGARNLPQRWIAGLARREALAGVIEALAERVAGGFARGRAQAGDAGGVEAGDAGGSEAGDAGAARGEAPAQGPATSLVGGLWSAPRYASLPALRYPPAGGAPGGARPAPPRCGRLPPAGPFAAPRDFTAKLAAIARDAAAATAVAGAGASTGAPRRLLRYTRGAGALSLAGGCLGGRWAAARAEGPPLLPLCAPAASPAPASPAGGAAALAAGDAARDRAEALAALSAGGNGASAGGVAALPPPRAPPAAPTLGALDPALLCAGAPVWAALDAGAGAADADGWLPGAGVFYYPQPAEGA